MMVSFVLLLGLESERKINLFNNAFEQLIIMDHSKIGLLLLHKRIEAKL